MGRILAIDYGKVRTGIAVTDELQIIASGLTTVHSSEIIAFLEKYFSENEVESIVIGEAKDLQNNPDLERFLDAVNRSYTTSNEQFAMLQRATTLRISLHNFRIHEIVSLLH